MTPKNSQKKPNLSSMSLLNNKNKENTKNKKNLDKKAPLIN